jgi:hypothetical protein
MLVLQSCSQKQEVSESTPLSFSMLCNETKAAPLRDDWLILKEYKERKNVVFDIQVANDARYENAINMALGTESSPDIILKVWPQSISEFANNGFLLPVSDYYDQMPFFKFYIESHNLDKELENLKLENGKYYLFPGFQRKIQVQQWIYRKDIFEKNNLEAPKTYDELFDSLVLLKKKYPYTDKIGNKYRTELISQRRNYGRLRRDTMVYPLLGINPRESYRWQLSQDAYKKLKLEEKIKLKKSKPYQLIFQLVQFYFDFLFLYGWPHRYFHYCFVLFHFFL